MFCKCFCCFGKTVVALAALLVCAATLSPAHAELIAYEGFNYDLDEPLGGQIGGGSFGWAGAWSGNPPTPHSYIHPGLTYTDSNGHHLVVTGGSAITSAVNHPGGAQPNRVLEATRNSDITWLSFIAQRLQPHDTDEENLLRAANLQLRMGDGDERLAFGKNTSDTIDGSLGNWSIYNGPNPDHAAYTDTSHLEQAFLVVRIDHHDGADNDEAWLWVNPLLAMEPSLGDATKFPVDREFSFDQIRIFAGGHQNAGTTTPERPYAEFAYDEIRVGTTYAAVTPFVPEPTSAVLLGLACVGGAFARFRRK